MFFLNDTATTEIYTLPLHDLFRSLGPLPRRRTAPARRGAEPAGGLQPGGRWPRDRPRRRLLRDGGLPSRTGDRGRQDRKSTRLNSSHSQISYAVFCFEKKINKSIT